MLVPAMSLQEIRAEFDKDFPIIFRKSSYVCEQVHKRYKPRIDEVVEHVYDYTSKYKNTWLYKVMVSKKKSESRYLLYFYGARGLVGIQPCTIQNETVLIYLTAHFINRYNERLKLNL